MQALLETTGGDFHPHTYLLDGNNLVAYIKQGETTPFYFKHPIKGFDKRGRKFEVLKKNPFNVKIKSNLITVQGSKGQTYSLDPDARTCTCAGFTFRGTCKHIESLNNV